MGRLDTERQQKLEPKRINKARTEIEALGLKITETSSTYLKFEFKGNTITYFPYSGWASGKGIIDGRGLDNLLKQLKEK